MTIDPSASTLDESFLPSRTGPAPSPFLPGTQIQFAWDSTCLGLIKTCPRLYQYTMLDGWASKDESVHLTFGIHYHAALEHFDHQLADGADHEAALEDTIRTILERVAGWVPDLNTKAGKYKNRDSLIGLVVNYIDHFHPDPATTYIKSDGVPAVEQSFRFELDWGPSASAEMTDDAVVISGKHSDLSITTSTAQPYLLCGHLDRVVSFNSELFVMDRKTTTTTLGPYYFSQYLPNNQMSLYTLAGRVILSAPIRGVIIDAAQIKLDEPNAFARSITYRTEAQLNEWLTDLRSTLAVAEAYATNGYWPQNDTSCDKFGGCRFRKICSLDPHVREKFLATDFIKLPEDTKWNPLRVR